MEAVFLKILNMSLSAAAVICAVLLARLALRRAPKKWSYLLWAVVAFRLVCPVSFSAPFSVLSLAAQPAAVSQSTMGTGSAMAYIPEDIAFQAAPRVFVGSSAVSQAVSQSLPAATAMNSANPMQVWIAVGTGVWCLGMAALLLYGIISYVNLKRRLREAVRVEEGVFETDAVRSPFILGLFRPVIYLPVGLTGEPLRYVLAHERFHLRRGDHAVKLLAFALLCLHWFNPLVWLAFCLMSRDMEMRCDEAVLSAEGGISKPYSMALLSLAAARRFPSPSPLCFGESGVKVRIKNVLRWKKPKVWVTVLCALLCAAAVAACAANPKTAEETGGPTGMPWNWTSTVRVSDTKSAEWNGVALSAEQRAELVRLLNDVKIDEVVRGRGIPSQNVLDITTGIGYRLRWAGGIIELDFGDTAAATELYGPGIWEIHNAALYDFLDGLEDPTPASAPDLAAEELPAADAWKLKVSSGGETVAAYEMVRFETTWTELGWLHADGEPVGAALENADEIPTLTLDRDFLVSFGAGITNRTYPTVYDLGFRLVQECSPAGASQLFLLEPGEYYVVFGVYGPVGRYIESEGRYEESGWDCIIRLKVDRQLAELWTPETLGDGALAKAVLGNEILTDEASLQKLSALLGTVEEFYPTKCPFGTVLWLTRDDGRVFTLCPAEDSCGVFWSGGTYYRYSDENEIWSLFYPEKS